MSDYKPTEYEDQDSTEERPAPPTKRRKYTAVAWYAAHSDRGSGPFICHFFLYFSELACLFGIELLTKWTKNMGKQGQLDYS